MSERGVFAVDRGLFGHSMFADEPLSEREAWLWMIADAAFKPHPKRVGSVIVNLKRGQLANSTRFMADKWKWSEARVRRFLSRLKDTPRKIDALIDVTTDAGVTVITVCNYDKYQILWLPSDAAQSTASDAASTQDRRKEEDREYRESTSSLRSDAAAPPTAPVSGDCRTPAGDLFGQPAPAKPPDPKAQLFITAKPQLESLGVAHDKAGRMLGRWLKDGHAPGEIAAAVVEARAQSPPDPIPYITAILNRKTAANGTSSHNRRTSATPGSRSTYADAVLAGVGNLAARIDRSRGSTRPDDGSLSASHGAAGGSTSER